jgi:protein phosphatase 2C family protein 2/3
LVRSYNEDRVSIILNIMRPVSLTEGTWPKCSFFGVYDGHGGAACADFLRDHLHQFIIKAPTFPWNPKEALRTGFHEAEKIFVGTVAARSQEHVTEKSGSCALVMLVVDDWCYVANVGDSRAIMSGERGKRLFLLSKDHKPGSEDESKRISEAGGSIYQSQTWQYRPTAEGLRKEPNLGPVRLLPGRLSVSRSFGDAEAKIERFGGNPSVLIATPDIRSFKISSDHDFVLLGCDGIFDMMTNKEAIAEAWSSLAQRREATVHRQCGVSVENVLRSAMERRSMDNVTVVMVAFKGFKRRFKTGN